MIGCTCCSSQDSADRFARISPISAVTASGVRPVARTSTTSCSAMHMSFHHSQESDRPAFDVPAPETASWSCADVHQLLIEYNLQDVRSIDGSWVIRALLPAGHAVLCPCCLVSRYPRDLAGYSRLPPEPIGC